MPNWCSNVVTISSDDSELMAKVKSAAEGATDSGFFNALFPRPVEEEENWYGWNVNNWGTKWDTGVEITDQSDNEIVLTFDTAWGPPTGFYSYLVEELGYGVEAYYYEPGMAFAGTFIDGDDNYYEYSGANSDEVKEMLPQELDEMFCISESMAEWESENEEEDFNTEEEE